MSYELALEAAGAKVVAFEYFGSYQGDWFALVDYGEKRGYVHGSYGSCSGCDSFEAEFDYDEEKCKKHRWEGDISEPCKACEAMKEAYQEKLAEFGRGYLDPLLTQEEAEASATRNIEWDMDAKEMLAWVKAHPV